MKVIVGLGNPGREYAPTRHNVGWWLIDHLADVWRFDGWKKDGEAHVANGVVGGVKVRLVKPQTFMNLSGESLACLIDKRHEARAQGVKNVIVISDDLALPFGTIRLRPRGSAGGHNGLKSIIAALKTEEFARLRIGIQPPHPVGDTKRFVLEEFSRSERAEVEKILERSADALRAVIRDGIDKAMATYNSFQ